MFNSFLPRLFYGIFIFSLFKRKAFAFLLFLISVSTAGVYVLCRYTQRSFGVTCDRKYETICIYIILMLIEVFFSLSVFPVIGDFVKIVESCKLVRGLLGIVAIVLQYLARWPSSM